MEAGLGIVALQAKDALRLLRNENPSSMAGGCTLSLTCCCHALDMAHWRTEQELGPTVYAPAVSAMPFTLALA